MTNSIYENLTLITSDHIEVDVNSTGAYDLLHSDSGDYYIVIGQGYIVQRGSKGSNPFHNPPAFLYADNPKRRNELLEWYHRKSD